ncbi:carboxymuconolactone decarboxylase family protein [Xanthovirga aplysinae]|uniref:carboxymuconolactone decarboxylase family protein n=1 Tax=Xanthovirga aplysinae TaxID=2529853 RepID=UPI0012BC3D27|nr:carboxymuconolactone decarboxylase family protein [Xanthovirga aplysinae]MTI30235.1 alkylhydroperoxidase [Xanthovirga aplysinae]
MSVVIEIKEDLQKDLQLSESFPVLDYLAENDSKYIKDLRVNLKNSIQTETINRKEGLLIALAVAANEKHQALTRAFQQLALEEGASEAEISEAYACASLLATNNVLYRFKHFMKKDSYEHLPVKVKMGIMMRPVLGKEFFELLSTVISAVNGCEMCVNAHEASLSQLGTSEQRIFDATRLGAVVVGLSKVVS